MTLRQAISGAADRLSGSDHLAPTAGRDAELLLLHTLSVPRSTLYTAPNRLLSPEEQQTFFRAVERRLALEPVQYITGTQEFFGLAFEVGPAVLIPRPETEILVEAALDCLPADRELRIADVGTGSGAIAIAIASRLPLASVVAIDLSAAALDVARRNVHTHGLGDRVHLLEGDLLGSVSEDAALDAVLSNPPYVPAVDSEGLHPQVRDHEPHSALFAGSDGLDVYRRLIPEARRALRAGGLLAMEIGFGQSEALAGLLKDWNAPHFLPDLGGIPRVVLARKP